MFLRTATQQDRAIYASAAHRSAEQSAHSRMADGWTAAVSPSPVRVLRGHTERDARRLRKQMANSVREHLVGIGHPLPLMPSEPRTE